MIFLLLVVYHSENGWNFILHQLIVKSLVTVGKIAEVFFFNDLGVFFLFTDSKVVNPSAFVLTYSIFGIEAENIIIKQFLDHEINSNKNN
jgi:hypothetical protein